MCLTLSKVASSDRWNWDGDHIIHVYAKRSKSHTLYGDAPSYTRQLEWRTKAAAAHIAAAFSAHPGRGAPA